MKKLAMMLAILALVLAIFGSCGKDEPIDVTTTTVVPSETTVENSIPSGVWELTDVKRDSELIRRLKDLPEYEELEVDGVRVFRTDYAIYMVSKVEDIPICSSHYPGSLEDGIAIDDDAFLVYDEDAFLRVYKEGKSVKSIALPSKATLIEATSAKACLLSEDGNLIIVDIKEESYKVEGEGIIDVDPYFSSIWYLTDKGEVYQIKDWRTTNKDSILRAEGAIALSPNMSDAPGWFIPGAINKEYDWVRPELKATFVHS